MVTLNILLVLLGFINSLNKQPKNAVVENPEIGIIAISDWTSC